MTIEEKFDELCYKIEGVDLKCNCIPEYEEIIKSWNLPLEKEVELILHCQELANKVNDRFWNIDRSSSSYNICQERVETITYKRSEIDFDDIPEIDF